eukprot:tig00020801_g13992.t1
MRSVASFDALDDAVLGGVLARLGPAGAWRARLVCRRFRDIVVDGIEWGSLRFEAARVEALTGFGGAIQRGTLRVARGASLELELAPPPKEDADAADRCAALGRLAVAAALACWEAAGGLRSLRVAWRVPTFPGLAGAMQEHAAALLEALPPSGALESLALTVDGCGAGDPRGPAARRGPGPAFHVDAAAVARLRRFPALGALALPGGLQLRADETAALSAALPRLRRLQVGLANQYALEGLYPLPLESLSAGPLLAPDEPFVRLAASPAGRSLRTLRLWRSDGGAVLLPRRALSHLSRLPSLTAFDFCASLEAGDGGEEPLDLPPRLRRACFRLQLADSPGAAAAARALAGALRRCTPLTDLELRFEFLEPLGEGPGGTLLELLEAAGPRLRRARLAAAGTARGGRARRGCGGGAPWALRWRLPSRRTGSGAQRDARL